MERFYYQNPANREDQNRRFFVILARPEKPENVGLVARCMKNLGFENLRLVKQKGVEGGALRTAIHARDILEKANFYPDLTEAVSDLNLVFAATSKLRKNFSSLTFAEAIQKIFDFPPSTKIGLLFGNERTGLTSEELKSSNFRFTIPQATRQPSYNLAQAVLITLFQIFINSSQGKEAGLEMPLPRWEQDECLRLILEKLEKKKFIHKTNKAHVSEMIYDLFGRLVMTARDRNLLLALFSKGIDEKRTTPSRKE